MAKETSKTIVYSALEVANICGVVNQTVINWIKKGYLSAFSTPGNQYRVYQEDLVAFMKSRNMKVPFEVSEVSNKRNSKNHSILVIEDERGLNLVLAKFLERNFEGHKITSAFDSFEAGSLLAEKDADIVLIDLDIAGVDGLSLCKKISESDAFGKPVIAAIIGRQDEEAVKELNEIGVKALFRKPLN
ncbi:MAG: response regulator, partial [Treponemataceae bacterium]|nr:response regulator [Treponemataceae bacterium]